MTTRADAARDTVIIDGAPTDTCRSSITRVNHGSKMGIDATQKTAEEGYEREVQIPVSADTDTVKLVTSRWSEYFLARAYRLVEIISITEYPIWCIESK